MEQRHLAEGPISPGIKGQQLPSRVVLRKIGNGIEPYVTHVEVLTHEMEHSEYVWGHYFSKYEEALKDFAKRVQGA
ncbi:MAG: hypothetical protein WC683_02725 [bacterium]